MKFHEVHLHCTARSRKLQRLRRALPELRPKLDCDPHNIPAGSLCFEFPYGSEYMLEQEAAVLKIGFQWGGGGDPNWDDSDAFGDYLFGIASGTNQLKIWNIVDPTTPSAVATLTLPSQPTGIKWSGGRLFISCGDGALLEINIDDINNPELEPQASSGGVWAALRMDGGIAVATGTLSDGIGLFNVGVSPPALIGGELFETAEGTTPVVHRGRRLMFATSVGNPHPELFSYRRGGFECHAANIDQAKIERLIAQRIETASLVAKGAVVAHQGVFAEKGEVACDEIKLGPVKIIWVDGDPNGVFTRPQGSVALDTDGEIWRNVDGADTWTRSEP